MCEICGKGENPKKEIKDHMKTYKPKCEICGKEDNTEDLSLIQTF